MAGLPPKSRSQSNSTTHGLRLVLVGVAAGIGAAFQANRVMGTILFGVSPTDLRTMIGVPWGLMTVALAACLVPRAACRRG